MTTSALSEPLVATTMKGQKVAVEVTTSMGVLLTAANVVKAVVGSGILSLSWAFSFSSLVPGALFTTLIGLLAAQNFAMLGICSERTGSDSFNGLWEFAVGKRFAWVMDVLVAILCIAATLSFLIIIGDFLPRGLQGIGLNLPLVSDRRGAILLVSAMLLPLNFKEDLGILGRFSALGTAASLYTCLVLVSVYLEYGTDASDWKAWSPQPEGIFITMPSVAFAFNGHFNAPLLYQELSSRSVPRWLLVTLLAWLFCIAVSVVCGTAGYVAFGSALALPGRSDVLTAPELQDRASVTAAYIAQTSSVALGVPLYIQAIRSSLERLWLAAPAQLSDSARKLSTRQRTNLLSAVSVVVTVGSSMFITELGIVADLTGALTSSLVVFVIPSYFYLKCICTDGGSQQPMSKKTLLLKLLAWLSIITGAAMGVLGVVATSIL